MRIARVTTLLNYGGQERKLVSFTDKPYLLRNSYIFSAIGNGGEAEKIINERNFVTKVFNLNPKIHNVTNILYLYQWFKHIQPDVVHTAAAEANFHGVIAAKLAGVKYIVAEEIGCPNHSKLARYIFRFIYMFTTKVVCVSYAVQNHLINIGEIKKNQSVVIYNPVSKPHKFLREEHQRFTLVTIGRLEPVKNHKLLIQALSQIDDITIQLIIVGDGSDRNQLEQLSNKLGLQDRVLFTGYTNTPEKYLAKADLFVLPSLSEGFGIAAVEAMFCNVPTLCTNVGGCPELIQENESGWSFNPHDLEELVDKINMISQLDQSELAKVAERARSFALQNFTSQQYVETLENFYDSLIDQNE